MIYVYIGLGLLILLALLVVFLAYLCFRLTFYVTKKQKKEPTPYPMPLGEIYEPYREQIVRWTKEIDAMDKTEYQIQAFDGLILKANYYEYQKGAPIEIMFHGYRGSARRDLSGGIQRCFQQGRNVLVVDQRASGASEGNVIGFGIHESKDCLAWIDLVLREFGEETKIMLTGVSMGAATVMTVADKDLPPNVVGILADCGYTTPKAIIQKVVKDLKLPPKATYPFIYFGARWFGHLDLHSDSPMKAVQNAKVPILFVHGDTDDFVPFEMSKQLYEACPSQKKMVAVNGAGHGLAYPVNPRLYFDELTEFSAMCGIPVNKQ